MDVLLIVDMQEGMLLGSAKRDHSGVVERINGLAERVRNRGGRVVFIQYDGAAGDDSTNNRPPWAGFRIYSTANNFHITRP